MDTFGSILSNTLTDVQTLLQCPTFSLLFWGCATAFILSYVLPSARRSIPIGARLFAPTLIVGMLIISAIRQIFGALLL